MSPMSLLGMTFAEFSAWAAGLIGHDARVHGPLYTQLMRSGRFAPRELALWPGLPGSTQERLAALLPDLDLPSVVESRSSSDASGVATRKFVLRLSDQALVETVLIPMQGGRHYTVCVSAQVGCRMGCSFCHTARMGLVRNLHAHEIVGQVLAVIQAAAGTVRNVVFMGMGEPLDNVAAVATAVAILCERRGLALAPRHITVSTVGKAEGLARWHELGLGAVNLAVSLGAADDELRSALMPVNRTVPLETLKLILLGLGLPPRRRILLSYIVIPGVNDAPQQLERLIAWVQGLRVMVNLIPYNPIPSRAWRAPDAAELAAVRRKLSAAGVASHLRTTRGRAVMAACGQLGDPARRRVRTDAPLTA